MNDKIKDVSDVTAMALGGAVFMQWIPAVVGVVTILYTVWRIFESLDERHRKGQWPWGPFGKGWKSDA